MSSTIPASQSFLDKLELLVGRFRKYRHGRQRSLGIELEGGHPRDRDVHIDTSVHCCGNDPRGEGCDGSCRADCECYADCGCECCQACDHCDRYTDRCECEECMHCNDCDEHVSDCECVNSPHVSRHCVDLVREAEHPERRSSMVRESIPIDMDCTEDDICAECIEYQTEARGSYSSCDDQHSQCELDGSCGCSCECRCECETGELVDGEVVSRVLEVRRSPTWIHENYPVLVNKSAGGHQHKGGYSVLEYAWLMDPAFDSYLRGVLLKWGEVIHLNENAAFWERVRNGKSLLTKEHKPYLQVDLTSKDEERYHQLNYCWSLHETLELRLLPMFQKEELYIKMTLAVDGFIEAYLATKHEQFSKGEINVWHLLSLPKVA